MSTIARVSLAEAEFAAGQFRNLFDGCFDRWEVAGSIRRRRADIGDVEHVVIPKLRQPTQSLFGESDGRPVNQMRERIAKLIADGECTLHLYGESRSVRNGEKYTGLDLKGRLHELFMPEPGNWGCILAIRTGSGEFSKALVTRMIRRNYRQKDGWLWKKLSDVAVVKPEDRQAIDGHFFGRVICSDEATFFAAAGLDLDDWPPEKRTDEAARRL